MATVLLPVWWPHCDSHQEKVILCWPLCDGHVVMITPWWLLCDGHGVMSTCDGHSVMATIQWSLHEDHCEGQYCVVVTVWWSLMMATVWWPLVDHYCVIGRAGAGFWVGKRLLSGFLMASDFASLLSTLWGLFPSFSLLKRIKWVSLVNVALKVLTAAHNNPLRILTCELGVKCVCCGNIGLPAFWIITDT